MVIRHSVKELLAKNRVTQPMHEIHSRCFKLFSFTVYLWTKTKFGQIILLYNQFKKYHYKSSFTYKAINYIHEDA